MNWQQLVNMLLPLSNIHKSRFDEIKKKLSLLGCKESSFISIELLFYEAINISRTYSDDPTENKLLSALKQLQADQYHSAKELFRKSSQKEQAIRRFNVQFKNVLSLGIKDFYSKQPIQKVWKFGLCFIVFLAGQSQTKAWSSIPTTYQPLSTVIRHLISPFPVF